VSGLPYVVPVTIQYPSGTGLSSLTVSLRNQTSDEVITQVTDSSGAVVFDCSNFAQGYSIGDVIEWSVVYSTYEGSDTHTIVAGGGMTASTLVLSAYPSVPQLRYFTPKDFYTTFDVEPYSSSSQTGIRSRKLALIGEGVEADIDGDVSCRFDSGNAVTNEYHDMDSASQKTFFLNRGPVQSISSVQVNKADEDQSPTWTTLDVSNYDFENYGSTTRVTLTSADDFPAVGHNQIRVSYTYGYSAVPKDIKLLSITETGYRMKGIEFVRQMIGGEAPGETMEEVFDKYRDRILNKYRQGFIRRA